MSIQIKDETAGVLLITIDNNGNMAFGDGTPINRLTLDGYGIIDSNGYIVHGVGSNAVQPVNGSVSLQMYQGVEIDTASGRIPLLQVLTNYPAYYVEFTDTGNIGPAGQPIGDPYYVDQPGQPEVSYFPDVGSFDLVNGDGYDQSYYFPNPPSAQASYRWL